MKAELNAAIKRIGELTMENELLRAKMEKPGPLAPRRSPAMSEATSPGNGPGLYGVERVCALWGVPRSSFHAGQRRRVAGNTKPPTRRRGPKPTIPDEALLAAIKADLEAFPVARRRAPRCGPSFGCATASGYRASGCSG